MASVNEALNDAAVSHAIDFEHYSNGVVRRLIALLNRVDPSLFAQLMEALERLPADSFTVERLESVLVSVRALNAELYRQVEQDLTTELRDLVAYEAGYQRQLLVTTIPQPVQVRFAIAAVDVQQVYSAAMSRPFQGVLLRESLTGLEQSRAKLIRDTIRIGYVEAATTQQIIQRLRGTKARGYADGLLEAPRRHIESITRTALSHTAATTRDAFIEANTDLIKATVWQSTLDARTSSPCRLRDGKKYTPVDHKPIGHSYPWGAGPGRFHWCCRSSSAPVTRSWAELGIPIAEMEASTRASMDGQVPAEMSYAQWLEKQSASRQDQVLGPERGALLRKGGLKMEQLYTDKGRYLSLGDLRERDARAFERAGL